MENLQINPFRYERKYVIPQNKLASFKSEIFNKNFRKIYNKRAVNNLYFDDYDFKMYRANVDGLSSRKKIRIRWYGNLFENSKKTIEFKIKEEFLNIKKTLSLGNIKLESLSKVKQLSGKIFEITKLKDSKIHNLILDKIPVLLNSYKRDYFMNIDNNFRITIDHSLFFYSPISRIKTYEKNIIVEIKYHNNVNFNMDFKNLILSRFSKYVKGATETLLYKPNY